MLVRFFACLFSWDERPNMSKEAAEAAIGTKCDFANGAAELWTEPGILCKEAAGAAVSTKCDFANGGLNCGRGAIFLLKNNPAVDMSAAGCYI